MATAAILVSSQPVYECGGGRGGAGGGVFLLRRPGDPCPPQALLLHTLPVARPKEMPSGPAHPSTHSPLPPGRQARLRRGEGRGPRGAPPASASAGPECKSAPTLPRPPHKPPPLLTSWPRPPASGLPPDTSGVSTRPTLTSSLRGCATPPSPTPRPGLPGQPETSGRRSSRHAGTGREG